VTFLKMSGSIRLIFFQLAAGEGYCRIKIGGEEI